MTTGLTARQEQMLSFIESETARVGYPPTFREIGAHMDIRSTFGVSEHLKALERKGFIERQGLKSRGIRVIRRLDPTPTATPPTEAEDRSAYLALLLKAESSARELVKAEALAIQEREIASHPYTPVEHEMHRRLVTCQQALAALSQYRTAIPAVVGRYAVVGQ